MLQPHVAKKLAYTQPKEVETLRAVGVRIAGVEQLAAIISAWVEQEDEQTGGSPRGKQQMAAPLQMARHPGGKQHTWEHAVYKQRGGKNNKSAPLWEMAWTRFESKGESAEKIALTWESNPGKVSAVQTATIVKHLLTALTFGKPLSLDRLLQQWKQVPDEAQWAQLEEAVAMANLDARGEEFVKQRIDVIRVLVGDELADKPYGDKTDEDKAEYNRWVVLLEVYTAFKRANITPCFGGGSPTKKARAY